MKSSPRVPSARQEELLEAAYRYVLDHGLVELSLRPLAAAIGSSPRVLLFLFGTKEGLVRALLARARGDEIALLDRLRQTVSTLDLVTAVEAVWSWLVEAVHRPLLVLWVEAYARSLVEPDGPWGDFARQTVEDWLAVLASAQPSARRRSRGGEAERTLALAVLRGCLLDLLATGDRNRTSAAIRGYIATLTQRAG